MGSIVRYHPNERVDLGDLEAMQTVIVDEHQRWSNALFATGVNRILDGFTRSGAAASMTITLGKAIVAEVRGAATKFGQLLTEGLASQNVDFTGKPVATHGVWIRFVYADGEKANRFFWDDTVDEERVRLVNTRQVAGWNVTISTASPGAEWLQLYSVAWDGVSLATSTITDKRRFLFEGPADSTPTFTPAWGTGNDRNADRATYGVKTLDSFAQAVLKKIEEIQSSTARWYSATVEPLDKKVSRFGDLTLAGNYQIDGFLNIAAGGFGTEPNPAIHKGIKIVAAAAATGRPNPLYFLHADGEADPSQDGIVLYSVRDSMDDDGVHLKIGSIENEVYADDLVTFDSNGNVIISKGSLAVTAGIVSASSFIPSSFPATNGSGTAYNLSNLIRARGTLTSAGDGSNNVTIVAGLNIAAATVGVAGFTVTFATAMVGAYTVLVSSGQTSGPGTMRVAQCNPANRAAGSFIITVDEQGDLASTQVDCQNNVCTVDFIVLGAQ